MPPQVQRINSEQEGLGGGARSEDGNLFEGIDSIKPRSIHKLIEDLHVCVQSCSGRPYTPDHVKGKYHNCITCNDKEDYIFYSSDSIFIDKYSTLGMIATRVSTVIVRY